MCVAVSLSTERAVYFVLFVYLCPLVGISLHVTVSTDDVLPCFFVVDD